MGETNGSLASRGGGEVGEGGREGSVVAFEGMWRDDVPVR